jgi:hypothetical protein
MLDDLDDDMIFDADNEEVFDDEPGTWNFVAYKMDYEGFDYCFRCYADFKEMNDPEFHALRQAYVDAAHALEEFVKAKADPKYLISLGIA